mgnify:CR=1 FL=1
MVASDVREGRGVTRHRSVLSGQGDHVRAGSEPATEITGSWLLSVGAACALVTAILLADVLEGPKTAYVGVLTAVPLFAAIFGTARQTAIAAVITWSAAFAFGHLASDGNVTAQKVRLGFIAGAGLLAVVAAHSRVAREHALLRAQVEAAEASLLREHATHDELTGLLNRRGLTEAVAELPAEPRTLVLIDCDRFKAVNDTYGHAVGDDLLRAIAGRIRSNLAREDIVARWGGDEFLVVIRAPLADAPGLCERLHAAVTSGPVTSRAGVLPVAMCLGAAEWPTGADFDDALIRADRQLYARKAARQAI